MKNDEPSGVKITIYPSLALGNCVPPGVLCNTIASLHDGIQEIIRFLWSLRHKRGLMFHIVEITLTSLIEGLAWKLSNTEI